MNTLDGQNIVSARTLGTQYDQNSISITDDNGNHYRIKADVILSCLHEFKFKIVQKRKHKYLEEPEFWNGQEVLENDI